MFNILKVNPEFMPTPSWNIGHVLSWIIAAFAIAFVAFVCLTAIIF